MFLVRYLNSRKLFQRTSNFVLHENCRDVLPQIFYRASACLLSFIKIAQYQNKCAFEFQLFDDQVSIKKNKVLFVSATSISILNEITPILASLRILQNLLLSLLGKYFRISLPSSMSDLIRKVRGYGLPNEIKSKIMNYWNACGAYLKDLRDIDQHFYHLIENSYMITEPEVSIRILFPDNPECKSPDQFVYLRRIDGIQYLLKTFQDINNLYEEISEYLGFKQKDIIFSASLKHLVEDEVTEKRSVFMLYDEFLQMKDSAKANLLIRAVVFDQLPGGKVEMNEIGLSEGKNKKLNEALRRNSPDAAPKRAV